MTTEAPSRSAQDREQASAPNSPNSALRMLWGLAALVGTAGLATVVWAIATMPDYDPHPDANLTIIFGSSDWLSFLNTPR